MHFLCIAFKTCSIFIDTIVSDYNMDLSTCLHVGTADYVIPFAKFFKFHSLLGHAHIIDATLYTRNNHIEMINNAIYYIVIGSYLS